jgi:tetratricopeptide (TPR) repeat protein
MSAGDDLGSLGAIREAVDIYRKLARANRASFEAALATSLNNLSVRLNDVGDKGGALPAIEEAIEIRSRLAAKNLRRFSKDLKQSLRNRERIRQAAQ